ncbi:MAG: type II toxin-antitoxin system RelE/ParE family toxin [archaeon]|jgi:mRNA-degrading endonuclease RelE of RelBE toxin-antitoxin system
MWQVLLMPEAIKDLAQLDKDAAIQMTKKLESLSQEQDPRIEKVVGSGYHKIRAGDYRALVVLDYKSKTIEVRKIGHRKKIYKDL